MSSSTKKAVENLNNQVVRSLREGDGCLVEADSKVNSASRKIIQAMLAENGEVWFGKINIYGYMKADPKPPVLWKRDNKTSRDLNFSADFILSHRDLILEEMLVEWNRTGGGTMDLIVAIFVRIKESGGHQLVWS